MLVLAEADIADEAVAIDSVLEVEPLLDPVVDALMTVTPVVEPEVYVLVVASCGRGA